MGQYLRPTPQHLPVVEYITPAQFEFYRRNCTQKRIRTCRLRSARAQLLSRGRFSSRRSLVMERDRSRIAAVIPAYQEEKHVGEVAQRTRAQLENVLVVDDGSTDATAERARSSGVDVVIHPQNRGKGESIKTGLRYWLERGSEYVVLLDADGQHLPEEISRFVDAAASESRRENFHWHAHERRQRDAVRAADRESVHERRISRVCGQQIPDTQCGFRMLHRDIIPEVLSGAEPVRLRDRNAHHREPERPSHRIGSDQRPIYSDEVSSIHPVRDTIRFFKLMRRYRNL